MKPRPPVTRYVVAMFLANAEVSMGRVRPSGPERRREVDPPTADGSQDCPPKVRFASGGTSGRKYELRWRAHFWSARVAPRHLGAESGELLDVARRARVVGAQAASVRGEAEGQGHVEVRERLHLSVEPAEGARA